MMRANDAGRFGKDGDIPMADQDNPSIRSGLARGAKAHYLDQPSIRWPIEQNRRG
jgi:hypothetical protein